MNSLRMRKWVMVLMLLACGLVYTSAMSLIPTAGAASPLQMML